MKRAADAADDAAKRLKQEGAGTAMPALPPPVMKVDQQPPDSSPAPAATQALQPTGQPLSSGISEARLCFVFLNSGKCDKGAGCKFRHVADDHPDAVADRIKSGQFEKIPAHVNPFVDQNKNCPPNERRICYSYLNSGRCERPECTFRHLLDGHPDAVADRLKSGRNLDKIPQYAIEAMGPNAPLAMAGPRALPVASPLSLPAGPHAMPRAPMRPAMTPGASPPWARFGPRGPLPMGGARPGGAAC